MLFTSLISSLQQGLSLKLKLDWQRCALVPTTDSAMVISTDISVCSFYVCLIDSDSGPIAFMSNALLSEHYLHRMMVSCISNVKHHISRVCILSLSLVGGQVSCQDDSSQAGKASYCP